MSGCVERVRERGWMSGCVEGVDEWGCEWV